MKPTSWKSALRAATKVAFATSLVGCGGVVVVDSTGESDTDTTDETTPDVVVPPEPRTECVAPAAGWETYDAATFDCCIDAVQARIAEGPLDFGTTVTDEISGCCAQLVTPNYDALWNGQPLAYDAPSDVIVACCDLRHGNPGCTPWGPPSPPSMDPGDASPWVALMSRALLGGVA
ncbi:MAG TPA: hypothetical protein VL400_12345 [Polyangiaceae bacterium]|jgi:hypothetical protein|nr:hypothetical protein [Polyangiaceae bacterium]